MSGGHQQNDISRFYVGKVGISSTTMAEMLALIEEQSCRRSAAYICVANVETTLLAQRDRGFCRIQNESLLTVPDGMPLIWYARIMGDKRGERITGPDLLTEILKISCDCGYSHYFYGDTEETLAGIAKKMHESYRGAEIRGMCSPPFRPLRDDEIDQTIAQINRLAPTFVWVGLGAPKQERWMARVLPRIDRSILIGVGAAFRALNGQYKNPPRFVDACGLKGLFWRQPMPIRKRIRWYCIHVPAFGFLVLKGLARRVLAK